MSWAVDKQRAGTCPGRSVEAGRRQRWTRDLDSSTVTGWEGDGWLSALALRTQGPTLLSPMPMKAAPPLVPVLPLPTQVGPNFLSPPPRSGGPSAGLGGGDGGGRRRESCCPSSLLPRHHRGINTCFPWAFPFHKEPTSKTQQNTLSLLCSPSELLNLKCI